jgi:hypothetical protein
MANIAVSGGQPLTAVACPALACNEDEVILDKSERGESGALEAFEPRANELRASLRTR